MHGFDEFFGNLYHLNAEEEPEHPDYPKDPAFKARFGPRGVLKCTATTTDDATVDPRFGRIGRQTIQDTGALTKKRMETIDDETCTAAVDFIQRQTRANRPFFCWYNSTRMHAYTHVRPEYLGRSGISEYFDGMLEHDGHVGQLLKALDDLNIANDTVVIYTTDNGPHMNTWPDGAMTPFRGEKNTNWEGAYRVPAMVRWPGRIQAGLRLERDRRCAGLVPDPAGRGRRHRRQGPSAERLADGWTKFQGASRRPQPAALRHRAAG